MRIAVYCSARPDIPAEYHTDARALGQWIGQNHHTLVYGGLRYSMMEDVASAAAEAGARVMGFVPESRAGHAHPANTVNIHVSTLHERKQMMEENADIFVALEGGIGTLDEVFSAMASSSFFNEQKEVHLLNRDGLYEPLRELLRSLTEKHLVNPSSAARFHFHDSIGQLTDALSAAATHLEE